MKIYFKAAQQTKVNNIKQLLILGYTTNVDEKISVGFAKTYLNPECTQKQCHSARRSFEDLLCICKTYFPSTTKKRLAQVLWKLHHSKQLHFQIFICHTIHKVVFSKSLGCWVGFKQYFGSGYNHEPTFKGESPYCFNDILKLAGQQPMPTHIKST